MNILIDKMKETDYPLFNETYEIIGISMEIHRILGKSFSEIVYKDALEYEFKLNKIPFEREKEYSVPYKEIILPHRFYADFVVRGNIILEVKGQKMINQEAISQAINYLAVSKCKVGLIVNFGENSLNSKRIIL